MYVNKTKEKTRTGNMVFKVNRGKMDFFSDKKKKDNRTGSYWSEGGNDQIGRGF